jgi:hypothetical protein
MGYIRKIYMHPTRRRRRREPRRRGMNHYSMANVGGYRHGDYKRRRTRRRGY